MEREKMANNLAKIRKDRRMTQQQMSSATGYTQGQICAWEHGKVMMIPTAEKLSKALGITIDELFKKGE